MPREIEEQDLERAVDALSNAPPVTPLSSNTWVTTSFSTWEPGYEDILLQAGECHTSVKEIMNRICALEAAVSELKKGGFCL